jgi:hypothetical protein
MEVKKNFGEWVSQGLFSVSGFKKERPELEIGSRYWPGFRFPVQVFKFISSFSIIS